MLETERYMSTHLIVTALRVHQCQDRTVANHLIRLYG